MSKGNFSIADQEVTVYFDLYDDGGATCDYCHKPGALKQKAVVHSIEADGVPLRKGTKLYIATETALNSYLMTGKAVHKGQPCEQEWLAPARALKDVVLEID